ncbi:hypothetical protein MLD52_08745 [Puniceicoccaceae bacterium K14]|nr:hypothetical protein [Puniceicoccaceae bacterium K14]
MTFRTDTTYELTTACLNGHDNIPPLIFHTLFENLLTHNVYEIGNTYHFTLEASKTSISRTYHLIVPKSKMRTPAKAIGQGTGSKYIKARLEESFPGNWTFQENETESERITEISIHDIS